MKIITFMGGLGNQIIEYAYYVRLKQKFPNEKFYGYYPSSSFKHNVGVELDKYFDVSIPQATKWTNLIGSILFIMNKYLTKLDVYTPFTSRVTHINDKALFHCDYWQDKDLLINRFDFSFKPMDLGKDNEEIINKIADRNSVAVHVRRGDYLNACIKHIYDGICTEKYYQKAIQIIKEKVDNPYFIFFSDDVEYVRTHFQMEDTDMVVVDWNVGNRSFIDMLLMSRCKNMILANSTFSYCAARLNNNAKMILCPIKWNNLPHSPNLTMEEWIEVAPD